MRRFYSISLPPSSALPHYSNILGQNPDVFLRKWGILLSLILYILFHKWQKVRWPHLLHLLPQLPRDRLWKRKSWQCWYWPSQSEIKKNNYFVLLRIVFFLEKFGCVCLDFLHPNENNSIEYGEYSPYSLHNHWRKLGLFKNSVVVGCIAC